MKIIIKLAVVAVVANAAYHLMTAYIAYYKFTDAVQQTTQYSSDKSLDELRTRIAALAAEHDVPVGPDDFTLTREERHTIVDGSYRRMVDFAPGISRAWRFAFHTDTYTPEVQQGDR